MSEVKDFIYKEPFHTEPMEDFANWAATNATRADELTLVDYYKTLKKSIALTSAGGGIHAEILKTLGSPINITSHDMIVSFYVDAAQLAEVAGISLRLSDNGASNFIVHSIFDTGSPAGVAGWQTVKLSCTGHTSTGGTVATALSSFQKMRFRLTTKGAAQTPTVVIDSIRFVPALPKATYFLTFDDGVEEDLLVTAYLNSKGIPGTFYVGANTTGDPGNLTLANLTQMQNEGHLIANHSFNQESLQSDTLTPEEAIASIVKATDWFNDNGFTKGARVWAAPGGTVETHSWDSDWNMLKPYCDTLRHTVTPIDGPSFIDYGNLFTAVFDNPTSAEDDYLSQTYLDNGSLIILGFHSDNAAVSNGTVLTQAFMDFIDALASKISSGEAQVLTMDSISAPQTGGVMPLTGLLS